MPDRLGRPKCIVRVCWERLADPSVMGVFNSHLRESFNQIPREVGHIESEWTMFPSSIVDIRRSPGDIVGRWKEYFEDLLNPTDMPTGIEEPEAEDSEVDSFITQAEVTEVVQQLLGGKAPGVDEIRPEYLKSLDVVGLSCLTCLCNIAWRSGTVPLDWATGVVVPLFKKGDRRVCSNYRGITLLSLPGKVYSRVLERRVRPLVEPRIQEEQCGFRPSRGTLDQLYTLHRVLEGPWEFAQPVHMCFVDLEKAFDRVPHGILWEVLWEYGVRGPLLRAVRSLYNRSRSLVRIASCKSDLFPVHVGLRQGCPLSPVLFIVFMDRISRRSQGLDGVRFGDHRFSSLIFADVVLLAPSSLDLQHALGRFAAECEAAGMRVSTSKSEAMVLDREKVACTLQVGGEVLPQVEEFKYLGVLFTSEGRMDREIDRRIGAAAAVMRSMYRSVVVKKELSRKKSNGKAHGGSEKQERDKWGEQRNRRQGQRVRRDVHSRAEAPSDIHSRAAEPSDVHSRAAGPSDVHRRAAAPSDVHRRTTAPGRRCPSRWGLKLPKGREGESKVLPELSSAGNSTNFIPDRSRPGLTTTAIGAVDLQGAGGNWATVGRRSRGGRRVHRQREKRKGKSVGLRIGTLNVGTMTGKGRELADMMERRKVDILCVQETRWKGSKARSIGAGFKLFYYGVDSKRNGVGVVLKEEFVRNVLEVKRVSDRVMSLKLEIEGVMLNVVSGYAPQVGCELGEKERFWSELDEVMESIPTGERVVIGTDFNGHVGEGNTGDEEVMGKFGVKERNLEGQMVVDFAKRMDMAVVNTCFQKREEHRVTYKSGGRRTQVVLPDDWETTAEVIRGTGRKVLGVSSGRRKEDKETWWWNEEVQDSIQRKRLAKKKWDMDRTEENRQEYKELQRRVKREVSKAKQKAYDELYTRLDTREGEKDLYRLARQRDRDGKELQQVRVIKDRDERVLTSEESVQRRWKEYFEELMNEENEREKRVEGVNSVEQKVDKIRKDEVRKALKRMKSGKAVGPDDIPVEVWKCLGEAAVEFLTSLFNRVLESERMPEEWRRSVLVPIFKNKGDVQRCSNYRGIKLMSHTMKLWERVVEARLRKVVEICEKQYGFMPKKSTTDAIFALRILMEKYRDGQRELHCVFVDLEKAYDRVPREELWYCMRKSGVAEKYVRVVQDMYERSRTVVRCAVGQTEEFKVEVGLHQGSALSPFLFAIVMDQLSEEVRGGKGRELADVMERRKMDILCVQETRWKGSKARSIGAGFKLFYYGVDSKRNGVGVVLKEEFVRNVLEVKRVSDRVMSLKLEIEGVMLNVVSGYAPQVGCELEEKERFWSELDEVMESIPTGERVVIGADFNGHVGEGNTGDEEVMGKFGVKERNLEGQMVVDFAKRMDMGVVNTYFQKREEHRVTYKSGGRRTQVDYILCRRGNLKEISDCKVVVGESVARQHRMVVCRMTLMVCKTKRSKIEKKTKWWKLKKEECCEEFRQKLRQALGGQVVLPDDWETTAEVIRETGRKVLGVSSGRRKEDKETWWWNEEVQDSIQRKRLAKKKWDMDRTEENRQEYKELQRRVKREVSKAKQKAYDELYTRLDTREGEKDLYRLARQRDRDGKDVQQVRVIKDRDGRVLTSEESVQRRWKEYFEELMNEENEREKRVEGVNSVQQKVDKIRKDEVRKALKRMKSGKAVGPDDIPVEVWKCLGEAAVEFLANLFNRVLESERMPEEWRRSVLVPIFKNKGDVQSCSNYRGIKLMSHTMKVWERVVEARLRKVVDICEQQYGFMPRKSTTDAIFALRILMEKYRDGQKELHCVFVDLEKAYDRVPREELWYCMRKSGVAEKYVRVVQDMYERSRTVVRCAVGQTEEFNVEVGLHQGSALSPFLFAIVMDQLSEEVRQESPWTMMFADDIVICSESREQVEENLERWRFALERRGMKVSRSKTEYMCVNEREGSGTVRLQGEEVKKVQEFKYLGSTVQSNGECGKEVKKRVQAGWNGWRKVSGVLCDQKISARIKGKVYRTVVRPAMLYGLETVSLRKRQESELEVAELKMLRFSLGVTRLDRIRNEYIRGTAHVGRLGDKVREARLRWFGHVQRRE
ncbi:hypothetical protein QTP86_002418, partial [Hemibagrus guttatus]